jgi:hypothetical protein
MIAARLDGMDRGLNPGAPATGAASPFGAETLPRTLAEAAWTPWRSTPSFAMR